MNGIVDATGRTPLHHACMNDCPEAIVSMLRHGARVDAKDDDGDTPLHAASSAGCSEGIRALVEYGADIKALTAKGRTPHAALLLEAGADVNAPADSADGSAALSLATLNDCNADGIMKVLIQHGADVNGKNKEGYTALHRAAMYNDIDCIDVLISAGPIIEATDIPKSSPLAVAFRSAVHRGKEDNSALISTGASTNVKDNDGCTPLGLATICRNRSVMQMLLRSGADISSADNDGSSALHLAAAHDHCDSGDSTMATTMDLLLRWGADENAVDSLGNTPLTV
ncbi:unnamed protein product [Ectocarpus sp. 12 AP-2014]